MKAKIGDEFRPAPELKSMYYLHTFLIFAAAVLSWYVPLLMLAPFEVIFWASVVVCIFILPFFLIGLVWIPLFYRTMIYKLTENEITWKRGVWFRTMGIVPYNRITNVDIRQGPISRAFGISSLHIQTAGYSAATTRTSEISIEGTKNPDEIRDTIMDFVRGKKPVAAETYDGGDNVLGELVKIRKLLEKRK